MLTLPVLQPFVTQSAMNDFDRCPRHFMFAHRYNLVPKSFARRRALDIGSFAHILLQALYTGNSMEAAVHSLTSALDFALSEWQNRLDDSELMIDGISPEIATRELIEDAMLARAMITIFWTRYPLDLEAYEVLAVEQEITNPITHQRGTLDLVIREKATGGLWIVDHKTTDDSTIATCASYGFSHQLNNYADLVHYHYDQYPKGFIHNVLQKPSIKYCPNTKDALLLEPDYGDAIAKKLAAGSPLTEKQQETKNKVDAEVLADREFHSPFEKYLKRVEQWYSDRFTSTPDDPPLLRSFTHYSGTEVEKREWNNRITEMRATSQSTGVDCFPLRYYRVPSACRSHGRLCWFLPFCTSDPTIWDEIAQIHYEQKENDRGKYPNTSNPLAT